nr:MAG TPA: hypothetical protein [Caudoviricetes sp.]
MVLKTPAYVLSLSEGQTKHLGKDGVKHDNQMQIRHLQG